MTNPTQPRRATSIPLVTTIRHTRHDRPAEAGKDALFRFWWSAIVMPDKSDRPVWYTWARMQQHEVEWRRDG